MSNAHSTIAPTAGGSRRSIASAARSPDWSEQGSVALRDLTLRAYAVVSHRLAGRALPRFVRSRRQLETGVHFCSGRIISSDLASTSLGSWPERGGSNWPGQQMVFGCPSIVDGSRVSRIGREGWVGSRPRRRSAPRVRADRRYPVASAPGHRDTDQLPRLFPPACDRSTNACTDVSPARIADCFDRIHGPSCAAVVPASARRAIWVPATRRRVLVLGRGEELGHERGDLCWPLEEE